MTVIYESSNCKLFSHNRVICGYQNSDGNVVKYQLSEKLFNNFKIKRKNKLKIKEEDQDPDYLRIKCFLTECKSLKLFDTYNDDEIEKHKNDNIQLMNKFYEIPSKFREFFGENSTDIGQVTQIGTETYLIPPKCRFFNKSIEKIPTFLGESEKFDYIVIDPPFRCKYIKRLKKTCTNKSYQMLSNEEILKIPLQNYTHKNSLIIIWCTNSEIHEQFIKQDIMTEWNLKLIASWKWVKIDKSGDLFCTFDGSKKPYEKIFIATHSSSDSELEVPDDCMIFSQPSSIHSHKPPLEGKLFKFVFRIKNDQIFRLDLFQKLLPPVPKCLEIFARSLYENHTSIGLECLKLQNKILFDTHRS